MRAGQPSITSNTASAAASLGSAPEAGRSMPSTSANAAPLRRRRLRLPQQPHQLRRQTFRRAVLLQPLRHHLPLRQQVHQRGVRDLDEPADDGGGDRVHPVAHHMRHAGHRHLQAGRAGLDEPGSGSRVGVPARLRAAQEHRRHRPGGHGRAHRELHRPGDRHHRPQPRHLARREPQRLAERADQPTDLAAPAARHDDHRPLLGPDAVRSPEPRRVAAIHAAFHHRMSDKAHGHASRLEEGRLEGQQRQHPVHPLPDLRHPPGPPRPDLRRDVMHHPHAPRPHAPGEAQREARHVDGDKRRRPARKDVGLRHRHALAEPSQLRHHLEKAHQRQVAHREQAAQPMRLHALPADPGEDDVRPTPAQRRHQPGAEDVAGGFARDQVDQSQARPSLERPSALCALTAARRAPPGPPTGAATSTIPPSLSARKKQLRRPVWQATPV